ncbi:MAG: hypothetical protein AB7F50_03040 [Fimbriimonadaceae bacterium]
MSRRRALRRAFTLPEPQLDDFADPFYSGYVCKRPWIMNLSLDVDGYSRLLGGSGWESIVWSQSSQRSLASFEDSAQRIVVTPT